MFSFKHFIKYKIFGFCKNTENVNGLHRPKRKMVQNGVMSYKFYNYVSGNFVGGTS